MWAWAKQWRRKKNDDAGIVAHAPAAPYLLVHVADPLCKLQRVGNGGGEEDVVDVVRQKNDGLFPDNATLCME